MTAQEVANKIRDQFAPAITGEVAFRGEMSFTLQKPAVRDACRFAKETLGFDYLLDITSVDHFGDEPRFELVYELYGLAHGVHLRLKCTVSEDDCSAPTVTDLWPTADWHEREVFDMMGIRFVGHPDLRRILMWEGYPYHPLRKDFPLEGKSSEIPDVAFSEVAPLAGGPFVSSPTEGNTQVREPRARHAGDLAKPEKFIAEP